MAEQTLPAKIDENRQWLFERSFNGSTVADHAAQNDHIEGIETKILEVVVHGSSQVFATSPDGQNPKDLASHRPWSQ